MVQMLPFYWLPSSRLVLPALEPVALRPFDPKLRFPVVLMIVQFQANLLIVHKLFLLPAVLVEILVVLYLLLVKLCLLLFVLDTYQVEHLFCLRLKNHILLLMIMLNWVPIIEDNIKNMVNGLNLYFHQI